MAKEYPTEQDIGRQCVSNGGGRRKTAIIANVDSKGVTVRFPRDKHYTISRDTWMKHWWVL